MRAELGLGEPGAREAAGAGAGVGRLAPVFRQLSPSEPGRLCVEIGAGPGGTRRDWGRACAAARAGAGRVCGGLPGVWARCLQPRPPSDPRLLQGPFSVPTVFQLSRGPGLNSRQVPPPPPPPPPPGLEESERESCVVCARSRPTPRSLLGGAFPGSPPLGLGEPPGSGTRGRPG